MDKMLRVNLTDLTAKDEPFPDEWTFLGGRALSAKILLKEVDPKCDPLGPANKVIIAPGVLSGSVAPTSGRMSVGAKSPLTGGIKEANSGGQAGQKLMRLGYRAIIVEGKAKDASKRYLVAINKDGVTLRECPELKGLRTYAASEKLGAQFSNRAAFIMCGPAGELGLSGASVAFTDEGHRHPARHAARGGLGAAMGAKGLKAIAVDDEGTKARLAQDTATFKTYIANLSKEYLAGAQLFQFGTSTTVPLANMMSTFPTRNRREMQFEGADALDGAKIVANFASRGGSMHHCMTGCIVKCSNIVHDADGKYVTSALEFETLALCGSNCGIGDIDKVAQMDRLCDELGLDTIETGGAIGLAMDCGALKFGDADGAIALLDKVDKGDPLAETIGRGVVAVGKRFNAARVPAIRGQGVPAWEPRTLNATGITYATSAMGADHTAGLIVMPVADGAKASQESQLINALCDSSGFCQFQQPTIEDIRTLFNCMYGGSLTFEQTADIGWHCMQDEWEFNRRAGFGPEDNDLPAWMRTEAVPSNGAVFASSKEEIMRVFERMPISDELRQMRAVG
ncbi:MAG: aldehyde ferredoxin oxidoreductase [Deltaproteobacteria bacterium]|nr:aldehyde ferredoxin oxidoreductase [Deltaproteobacteria bacterium]MBI3386502.1 aldehyde ferredoxin oxidoreductase [Deltaproteobacteria bacterium]